MSDTRTAAARRWHAGKRFGERRKRFLIHQLRLNKRYKDSLNRDQLLLANLSAAAILAPTAVLGPGAIFRRKAKRTHLSTTEVLDTAYRPSLPVASDFRRNFEPTNIIDSAGRLNETIAEDAMAVRYRDIRQVVQANR